MEPFTTVDYRILNQYRPRVVCAGGNVRICQKAAEGLTEAGYIANPGSRPETDDWTFWREDDGMIHVEGRDEAEYLATDMADLMECVLRDWEAEAQARVEQLQQTGLRRLPERLR